MASGTPVAVEVETLLEQGELKAALKLLEGARTEALSGEDIASLHEVLAGARAVYARAEGKQRDEAGRVAYAAQQNIRFLGRKAAVAAGEQWRDPFREQHAAKPDQVATHEKRGLPGGDGFARADVSAPPHYAAWSERFRAWLLDMLIIFGVLLGVAVVVGVALTYAAPVAPGQDVGAGLGALTVAVAFPVLFPAYLAVFHGRASGQTPGKQQLGIAVRHVSTLERITYPRAFARSYLTMLFWLVPLVGSWTRFHGLAALVFVGILDGLWPLWDPRRQALHDKLARTVVIRV